MVNINKNNKFSLFNIIVIIGIILFLVLILIAFHSRKITSAILAIISIVLLMLVVFVKNSCKSSIIPIIIMIISFMLVIPYIYLLDFDNNYKKYEWNGILLANVIERPKSLYGEVISNSNKNLLLNVNKVSISEYRDYVKSSKNRGFVEGIVEENNQFKAYNQYGYELILNYTEKENKMSIIVNVPILKWSESKLAKLIPIPNSIMGKIEQDDESIFVAQVSNFSKDDYDNYAYACSNMGFNIDISKSLNKYSAQNNESYRILLEYVENHVMKITVYEASYNINIGVEYIEHTMLNKDDLKVYVNNSYLGIIKCGKKEEYNITLSKGNHKIRFVNSDDESIFREEVINVSKNDNFNYKILSTNSGIDIDTIAPSIKEIKIISPVSGEYKIGQEIKVRVYFSEYIKGIAPTLKLKIGNSSVVAGASNPDGNFDYIDYNYVTKSEYGKVDIESYSGGGLTDISGNVAKVFTLVNSGYQVSIKVPEQNRALFAQQKFVTSKNKTIEYWIYVPDISIIETYQNIPLIVALHMNGISSMNSLSSYSIMSYIKNKEIQPKAIVVAPLAYNGGSQINEHDTTSIIELIKNLLKTYDINQNKISIAGHSQGARNALRIAKANPNYFSACVLFSWVESGRDGERHDMQTKPMPTCKTRFVYEDRKNADYNRNIAINLSKTYSNISVQNVPNTAHETVIQAYKTTDILNWMIEQTR